MRPALSSLLLFVVICPAPAQDKKERHFLYVVAPGIRNDLKVGGAGILVFDIDNGHKFVRRIATPPSQEKAPLNIKGVCASAVTKKLYFSTLTTLSCVDLLTDKTEWTKALPGGCDRMSITSDGKILYVPSLEKDHWNVVDAASGEVVATIVTKNRAHNTVVGSSGKTMYLGGISLPTLFVADTKTHDVSKKIEGFGGGIRPLTVNADESLAYVNVNGLLGFEIADLKNGKILHRVEVPGFKEGPVKRHGCPSHGVGLTPDEKEVWVCDAANERVHVFDNTVSPPKLATSIKLREQPGWVTFTIDGKFAYPSTGDVIETLSKRIVVGLTDEEGREVHSEKVMEIVFADGTVIRVGDQFGVGRRK